MTAPDPASNGLDPQTGKDSKDTGNAGHSELSHEAALSELKRARDEAARYRQRAKEFADDETYKRAKDAVAALDKAEQEKKTEVQRLTEDKAQLLHRASSAEVGLLRLRVALGAGVSADRADEFASRLRGDTEDDLKKDAEQLARFFGASSTPARRGDPSQGAGSDAPTSADPIQAALESKLGIPR